MEDVSKMQETSDTESIGIIVVKRDGEEEDFDAEKISDSIMQAAIKVGGEDYELADELAGKISDMLESNGIYRIEAEKLQFMVEKLLIEEGHAATAKEYILFADDRRRQREMNSELMRAYEEVTFKSGEESNIKRENANIKSETAMGTMLKYGSEGAKSFNLMYIIPKDISMAHRYCDIHIHDADFYKLTTTCTQIDVAKLFKNGFNTGHTFIRPPKSIRVASAQMAIIIQSNQNDQHKRVNNFWNWLLTNLCLCRATCVE